MRVAPIPVKHAVRFVREHHRKLPNSHHRLWGVGLWSGGGLRGVGLVGAPSAQAWQPRMDADGWPQPYVRLEVVRVAVIEGTPNGCSMIYGSLSRAAKAMGCDDLYTYTRSDEPGTSLRAAGWFCEGQFGGGQADRPGRRRKLRDEAETQKRWRWWAPWSDFLKLTANVKFA